MKVLASLRVKTTGVGSLPPLPEQVSSAADVIQNQGIEVLRRGRRALTVSADLSKLERLVGRKIIGNVCAIEADKAAPGIATVVDLIEITPAPMH